VVAGPVADIPADQLAVMQQAAAGSSCCLDWSLLAGIAQVESGFGANMATSSAGAIGYGQFLPSSWAALPLRERLVPTHVGAEESILDVGAFHLTAAQQRRGPGLPAVGRPGHRPAAAAPGPGRPVLAGRRSRCLLAHRRQAPVPVAAGRAEPPALPPRRHLARRAAARSARAGADLGRDHPAAGRQPNRWGPRARRMSGRAVRPRGPMSGAGVVWSRATCRPGWRSSPRAAGWTWAAGGRPRRAQQHRRRPPWPRHEAQPWAP
jgi:hypothetical protein